MSFRGAVDDILGTQVIWFHNIYYANRRCGAAQLLKLAFKTTPIGVAKMPNS
jgi:hypothetical protein